MKKYEHIYNQRALRTTDIAENGDHQAAINMAKAQGKQIDTDGCKVYANGFLIARLIS